MTWVAVAVVGGSVIGAVGSNLAANKQAGAQRQAAQTQADMFNTIQGQEQPYMDQGNKAAGRLGDLLGTSGNTSASGYGDLTRSFTSQDYLNNKDPGYDFQLKTGAQALRNSDTPGVGSLSGAALKNLMGFNQDMAATGYQNAFNRYQTQSGNTYQRLMGLSSLGQNAAANTGSQGTALAGNQGAALAGAGASTASGILGGTSALSGGANTLAGLAYLNGTQGASASANGTNSLMNASNGGTTTTQGGYTVNLPGEP